MEAETIKILGWGCFFGIVGFGLGRLRFHTLIQRLFKNLPSYRKNSITYRIDPSLISIWATLYEQASENIRDLYKTNVTLSTIGIAASASIIASSNSKHPIIYLALAFFLIAAIFSTGPIGANTKKIMIELDRLDLKHKEKLGQRISLPLPLKKRRHPVSIHLTHFALTAAIISLILSLPSSSGFICNHIKATADINKKTISGFFLCLEPNKSDKDS